MATSPVSETTDLVNLTISVNGTEINSAYQVTAVHITKAINRISAATIELLDGDPAQESFTISNSGDFLPGATITISAGYHDAMASVFEGIIIKQSVKARSNESPVLMVECRDKSVKMTIGRNNALFENMTDSDVMGKLIGAHGLQKSVASTSYTYKELVQYYSTDWDFLLSRADANGLIVVTDAGKVNVLKPDSSQSPVLQLTYGDTIYNFSAEVDARTQYPSVTSSAWDSKGQSVLTATSQSQGITPPGNLSSSTLADVIGLSTYPLQTAAPLEQSDIQNWANGCYTKACFSQVKGHIEFQGNALALPGKIVELSGAGDRFNGNCLVSRVKHEIASGDWRTTVDIGLNNEWFTETQDNIESPLASGLLPGISGLQTGVVKQINSDPDNAFRVLVTLPLLNNKAVWARLATFYATSSAGAFFYPETGDEVVLGFFNDDPRYPVILGSLYSGAKSAPYTPDDKNSTKAIVTKGGVKVTIDDEKKILTLITPGNNSIVISDDAKSITLSDQNSNKIEMSSSGITIQSNASITLKANQNIDAQATANISVKATSNLTLEGLAVSGTAQTSMTMKGTAAAEFSASGPLTLKGAMVMIN